MAKGKVHTTNYFDTFIEVSEDTKAICGIKPPTKDKKTVAEMQYEMISQNPYKYTSDDILFQLFTYRNSLTEAEYNQAREQFFAKGQPCFRRVHRHGNVGGHINCNNAAAYNCFFNSQ